MNNVSLIGRLVRDPEVTELSSGIKKARFTLAVDREFAANKTDFIQCAAWRSQADFIGTYIKKGNLISVQGRIETGSYEKDGVWVYTTEVVADRVSGLQSKSETGNTTTTTKKETKQEAPKAAEVQTDDAPWDLDL